MATTNIIVEILVIGYTAFIWIIFFVAAAGVHSDVISWVKNNKEFVPLLTIFSTAIAYQIGYLLDYFSYIFFYYFCPYPSKEKGKFPIQVGLGRKFKREFINKNHFWHVFNFVNQKASDTVLKEIRTDHSTLRLTMSGFFNIVLIGYGALCVARTDMCVARTDMCVARTDMCLIILFSLCILMSIACVFAMNHRWKQWYSKIGISYYYLKAGDNSDWKKAISESFAKKIESKDSQ